MNYDDLRSALTRVQCDDLRNAMNSDERRLHDQLIAIIGHSRRVTFQTSLGAVFQTLRLCYCEKPLEGLEFRTLVDFIDKTRLDFVITDALAKPILAIEYDAPEHSGGRRTISVNAAGEVFSIDAAQRDHLVHLALEKMGVSLLRLTTLDPKEVRSEVTGALARRRQASEWYPKRAA